MQFWYSTLTKYNRGEFGGLLPLVEDLYQNFSALLQGCVPELCLNCSR